MALPDDTLNVESMVVQELLSAPPLAVGGGTTGLSTPKPTILVVEDDPVTLEYLTLLLQQNNYNVLSAMWGADALSVVASHRLEAILMDRRLPDTDGIVLTSEIRARTGSAIPIILMTADAESGLLAAAHAAGANQLLRKPFMPQTLLDVLAASVAT